MYSTNNTVDIKNSFFLTGRNIGASRKLCGDVATITCFVKNCADDFSEATKNNYFAALNKAHRWIERQAKKYNVPLKMHGYYFEIDAPNNMNEDNAWEILKGFFNQESMDALQAKYEVKLNSDETPFLVTFDKQSRSFAFMQRSAFPFYTNELSVIFKDNSNYSYQTIAHEILHQFGAVDLYFPDKICLCAEHYLGESIMGRSLSGMDDLNAFLVGWKDTISNNTHYFLKETMWYTKAEYMNALKKTWE